MLLSKEGRSVPNKMRIGQNCDRYHVNDTRGIQGVHHATGHRVIYLTSMLNIDIANRNKPMMWKS